MLGRTLNAPVIGALLLLAGAAGIAYVLGLGAPHAVAETAAAANGCVGDCGQNGIVTVDELLTMVNIALGSAAGAQCEAGDGNGDGQITIDEILKAVNNALNGCASAATPTPAGSAETPGPGGAVAARSVIVVNAMTVVPNVVVAIVAGSSFGKTGACPEGGLATRDGKFPSLSVTLSECKVATPRGSVTLDGSAGVQMTSFTADLQMQFADQAGMPTTQTTASLTGTFVPTEGGNCFLTAADFTLSTGSVSSAPGSSEEASINFENTSLTMDQLVFDPTCIPIMYRLALNGSAALVSGSGAPTSVTFNQLAMMVDDRNDPTLFALNGGLSSACLGGAASVATIQSLAVHSGAVCPTAGSITVTSSRGTAQVFYRADQSVDIDKGANGTIDKMLPNCLDPRLLMCLG